MILRDLESQPGLQNRSLVTRDVICADDHQTKSSPKPILPMFSSASSISGLTIASTSSFHGPGQPRASNTSAPPLESLSRFTPLTVNQAYAQRVPKHRSPSPSIGCEFYMAS